MTSTTESPRAGFLDLTGTVHLHHGGSLRNVRIAWRMTGPARAPVLIALGGISAHRFVCGDADTEGWWDAIAGPGRVLDSRRYRILGMDFLGGSGASTGPRHGEGYGIDFPSISTYDQADMVLRLLDHLDIAALHAFVGASYGGMVALAFAEKHPRRLERLIVLSAADRPHPMATAWRAVQRRVLTFAVRQGAVAEGVMLARALAMATYRSTREFEQRFRAPALVRDGRFVFPVEQYLFARGADYARRYDAGAFLRLSESIDLHQVDPARIRTPATLIGVHEDQLVPLSDMRSLRERLGGPAALTEIHSLYGHDAFLKESERIGPVLRSALESSLHD